MFWVSPFQRNISMRHEQMEEHKLSFFSSKPIFKPVLRIENKEQMYRKYKICEILNCDMTKVLEQKKLI